MLVSNTLDAGGGSILSAGGGLAAALEHIQGQRTLEPVERPVTVTGATAVPKMPVDGRCEDVIFFDGVFFEPSLKSVFFAT